MAQNEEREKMMKEQLENIDRQVKELLEDSLLLEQRRASLEQIQICMEHGHQWRIGDIVSTLTQVYTLDLICVCCKAYIPMCSPHEDSYNFDRIIHAPVGDDGEMIFSGNVYMANLFPEEEEDE